MVMGRMFARTAAVSIIAATGLFAACAWAEDAPAGNADNGKRIFIADGCFMCHGRAGEGGAFNYPAPALAQIELPVESFQAFLRELPAYSTAVLSDQEAADIHAFLRSLPGRRPVKDIPLL